jgi:hypothetical protein
MPLSSLHMHTRLQAHHTLSHFHRIAATLQLLTEITLAIIIAAWRSQGGGWQAPWPAARRPFEHDDRPHPSQRWLALRAAPNSSGLRAAAEGRALPHGGGGSAACTSEDMEAGLRLAAPRISSGPPPAQLEPAGCERTPHRLCRHLLFVMHFLQVTFMPELAGGGGVSSGSPQSGRSLQFRYPPTFAWRSHTTSD